MDKEKIDQMISIANDTLSKYGDGESHTVAAVIATQDGKFFHGLNLYHFTGGPCGEISALTRAMSDGAKNLTTIVAVADKGRGIVSPCGRCRQILFDFCPNIHVVIQKNGELISVPIRELLPESYDWFAQRS